MQDGVTRFQGNLNTYRELMNKTERELVANYMENHDTQYVLQNYNEIAQFLTTPELKNNFLSAIQQLSQELPRDNIVNISEYRSTQRSEIHPEMSEGYTINEFGEIIRPARSEEKQIEQPTQEQGIKQTKLEQLLIQIDMENN